MDHNPLRALMVWDKHRSTSCSSLFLESANERLPFLFVPHKWGETDGGRQTWQTARHYKLHEFAKGSCTVL